MGRTGARRVSGALSAAICLTLATSGCVVAPPPLMYPATTVPAGKYAFGGALGGSVEVGPAMGRTASSFGPTPLPGIQLSLRHGLGQGASFGVSVSGGPVLMLDGRLEVIHAAHLSLSLGLELGATGGIGSPGAVGVFGLTDVPVVLAVSVPQAGHSTFFFGLRPGLVVTVNGVGFTGIPMAGGLLGVSFPIGHGVAFSIQGDVSHSFELSPVPATVATLAVGVSG